MFSNGAWRSGGIIAVVLSSGFVLAEPSAVTPHVRAGDDRDHVARTGRSLRLPDDATYGMSIGYYSVLGNLQSSLSLNNKGPEEMGVRVTLYARDGRRWVHDEQVIGARTYVELDLRDLVQTAGAGFEDGSLRVSYTGQKMELGGMLRMGNADRGIEFDEQLMYPSNKRSNQLEGLWWLPDATTEARLVVTNTSGAAVTAQVRVRVAPSMKSHVVALTLKPWQLEVVDLAKFAARDGTSGQFGSVSIEYSGDAGAVVARGFVANMHRFSTVVQMTDPASVEGTELHGAGVRVQLPDGRPLSPVVLARNLSSDATQLRGRLRATASDGELITIDLPDTTIPAGQTILVDATSAWTAARDGSPDPASHSQIGIELEHSGFPGGMMLSVMSLSLDLDHSFRTLLTDLKALPSGTGGYFWDIRDGRSSVVFLKNTTDTPQRYDMVVRFDGGEWSPSVQKVGPRATLAVNIGALAEARVPDRKRRVIPTGASGQVYWSVIGGDNPKGLLGRMEHIDPARGLSSTYACPAPVTNNYDDSWIEPDPQEVVDGDYIRFSAMERDRDAFGGELPAYEINDILSWTSGSPGIASSDGAGWYLGVHEGYTQAHASGMSNGWEDYQGEGDPGEHVPIAEYAEIVVQCRRPKNFRQTNVTALSQGVLAFTYAWDSTVGTPAALSGCLVRERLNYPGTGTTYNWPEPFPESSYPNPGTIQTNGSNTPLPDYHLNGASYTFRPNPDYFQNSFVVTQRYEFSCDCHEKGAWTLMFGPGTEPAIAAGPHEITRSVVPNGEGGWKYTVTKPTNGSATRNPLPVGGEFDWLSTQVSPRHVWHNLVR